MKFKLISYNTLVFLFVCGVLFVLLSAIFSQGSELREQRNNVKFLQSRIAEIYLNHSPVAVCAEIVNSTCTLASKCKDNTELHIDCLNKALPLCKQFVGTAVNAQKAYEECIPDIDSVTCRQFEEGANFPLSCQRALSQ